jgi:hypothetical protein
MVLLHSPSWPPIYPVSQSGVELSIFLSLPLKCWDYRNESPLLVSLVILIVHESMYVSTSGHTAMISLPACMSSSFFKKLI